MDFIGQKINGKAVYPPAVLEQRRKAWEAIKDDSYFKSSLSVPRKSKSQSQLGAIFGLMLAEACSVLSDRGYDTSFIYNIEKPTGIEITTDDLKLFFYNICPIRDDSGKVITLSKSNTVQASKFFEDCRAWMSTQWAIVIADPCPNWRQNNG